MKNLSSLLEICFFGWMESHVGLSLVFRNARIRVKQSTKVYLPSKQFGLFTFQVIAKVYSIHSLSIHCPLSIQTRLPHSQFNVHPD